MWLRKEYGLYLKPNDKAYISIHITNRQLSSNELMVELGFSKIISGIVFASCGKDVRELYPDEMQIRNLEEMVYRIQQKYNSKEREIYFDNYYSQLFGKPCYFPT